MLRARLDRFVLVLDHCCDDLNHVAVLRSCEALGVMRVWLVDEQTAAYAHDGEGGSGAQQAGPRSRRRLAERAKQRGFAQEKLLGLRRAQLYCTWLDVRTFGDVDSCVRALRADGRQIWATDLSQQAVPLTSEVSALRAELPLRLAIVLGAEGLGVSPSFLRAADRRVFLPMYGMSESFNVSVAAALVMQRLCDACAADRGRLPAAELDETRRRWYRALARNEEQRRAFDTQAAEHAATMDRERNERRESVVAHLEKEERFKSYMSHQLLPGPTYSPSLRPLSHHSPGPCLAGT